MAYEKVLYEYFYQLDPFWLGAVHLRLEPDAGPALRPSHQTA